MVDVNLINNFYFSNSSDFIKTKEEKPLSIIDIHATPTFNFRSIGDNNFNENVNHETKKEENNFIENELNELKEKNIEEIEQGIEEFFKELDGPNYMQALDDLSNFLSYPTKTPTIINDDKTQTYDLITVDEDLTVHTFTVTVENVEVIEPQQVTHIDTNFFITQDNENNTCYLCGRNFKGRCYLLQHYNSVHTDKPLKCPKCSKRFFNELQLDEHYKKHKVDNKKYQCMAIGCIKWYAHKTDLKVHILNNHTKEKQHLCWCGKGFARKDHLVKHQMTHEKIRRNKSK